MQSPVDFSYSPLPMEEDQCQSDDNKITSDKIDNKSSESYKHLLENYPENNNGSMDKNYINNFYNMFSKCNCIKIFFE